MNAVRNSIVLLTMCIWVGSAFARFTQPSYIPTQRLIDNATAYIAEEPNDATGYYALARIHYLAFVNKAFLVGTFDEREASSVIPYWWWEDYQSAARRAEAIATALKEYGALSISDVDEKDLTAFYARVTEIEEALVEKGWEPDRPTTEQLVEHAGAAQVEFLPRPRRSIPTTRFTFWARPVWASSISTSSPKPGKPRCRRPCGRSYWMA